MVIGATKTASRNRKSGAINARALACSTRRCRRSCCFNSTPSSAALFSVTPGDVIARAMTDPCGNEGGATGGGRPAAPIRLLRQPGVEAFRQLLVVIGPELRRHHEGVLGIL